MFHYNRIVHGDYIDASGGSKVNTGSGTQTDADNSVVNVDKSITNVDNSISNTRLSRRLESYPLFHKAIIYINKYN